MRTAIAAAIAVALALTLAACGDDDTTSIPEVATGATGTQGAVESEGLTVEGFLVASTTDQLAAVEDAVNENPDCEGVDTDPGGDLQVNVAIDASTADPATPLAEIVADNC